MRFLLPLLLLLATLRADVPVPERVLQPKTPAEAWNILTLVSANLDRLLAENRLAEIPVQASLANPALRLLARGGGSPQLAALGVRGTNAITSLAQAATAGDAAATKDGLQAWRTLLRDLALLFPPTEVAAEISHCPMHPEFVSTDPRTPCDQCGMDLVPRRIPHSFLYVTPGQPIVALAATAPKLRKGVKADIRLRLRLRDGTPVTTKDLLVTHTQPIHLLIVDPGLTDYHHEHPVPTSTPGEYEFSFTPAKDGAYRIFADLLPASTSVQEYATTDLPGEGTAETVSSRPATFATTTGGLRFALEFDGGNGAPIPAGRVLGLRVTVTDASGQPMRGLEPVMNAFAHMVGFHEDYRTVVHLHPLGGEVHDQAARGGPTMSFRFLAPKAGYLRLYCQVQAEGKMIFAPFDLQIVP